ncbi:uncharacterized protein LOC133328547, partial [Musca vetustissima]|uniref:uncharacterized protein LOC133328547 n=1 Tax=Musca vetustissima TaxID=27455 RepID=UPI002AB7916D
MAGGKKHQSTPDTEVANIKQQKEKVIENIERIKTSFREKRISFNTIELECRLDILNKYIDDAMRLQSELDILDPDNNDRELADPNFNEPRKVDLLLGAEVFFELLCVGQIKSNPSYPVLQKTSLGWIVAGKYDESKGSNSGVCHLNVAIENDETIDTIVKKFWELEEIPNNCAKIRSEEHQKCEEHFQKYVRRLSSGRFQVSLPFKEDVRLLGSSFETAKRRFLALERKLSHDVTSKEMYNSFMKEYLDLGHMEKTNNKIPNNPHYFIPHQCVFRPQSTTTKLRVVFDASSKTSSHVSLNDLLMVGPTIQEELYSTLLRFRLHKYVITADIEKMYRQVLIDEKDRDFHLILWRQNESDPLQIFRLNTVTYGTSSAPFLAIRCLNHLSDLSKETWPIGAKVISNDFYVDDLLTGSADLNSLLTIRDEVTTILSSAGLNLTKWFSNHPDFNETTCSEKLLHSDSETARALGIHWAPRNDVLKFYIEGGFQDLKATKRHILSISSRLFDPLGLLCPIITKAKMLLQELWINKLDWDESIPMRLSSVWEDFKFNLS